MKTLNVFMHVRNFVGSDLDIFIDRSLANVAAGSLGG